MPSKGIRYILLAVVVGLGAVVAIHRGLAMRTNTAAQPTAQVLVAKADITSCTALSPRLVKAVAWPQQIVPPQAVRSVDQANGRVLQVPLSKGEAVLLSQLAPEGTAA